MGQGSQLKTRASSKLRRITASVAALIAMASVMATEAKAQSSCTLTTFNLPVTIDHMRASVPVQVNGKDTNFWLDSGAWFSTMSRAKAEELGLPRSSAPAGLFMRGIGGSFTPMVARISDFGIVGSALHNVDFLVGGSDAGNGLIGRNLLAVSDTEFDLANGTVKIIRPKDCNKSVMAYWAPGKPYFVTRLEPDNGRSTIHDFRVRVKIGTADVLAEIDSGARTLITRRAAERAGIDLAGPGVVPVDGIYGFGRRFEKGWRVPVASVSVGDENILNTRLTVIDGAIIAGDGPDMLLGIDFLLAHHVYVARSQGRIYFTYSGGLSAAGTGTARGYAL